MVAYRSIICATIALLGACVNANTGRENMQNYVDGFAPANLQYDQSTVTFYEGIAVTAQVPSVSVRKGLTRCVSSPALPAGLTLNAETCAISGTPLTAQAEVKYTITGSNDFGFSSTEIGIRIYIPPPSNLAYAGNPFTFSNYSSVGTITPTVNGTVTSCSSTPALPAGLSLNNTTCAITGTATNYQNPVDYTITASNALGSASATINIRVDECYLRGCFRDNMNGTVSFTGTADGYAGMNLVFMKCSQGQAWNSATNDCTGTGTAPTYGAGVYGVFGGNCGTLSFAGRGSGSWRMPTGLELSAMVHCTNKSKVSYGASGCGAGNGSAPSVNSLFPNTEITAACSSGHCGRYWASDSININVPPLTSFTYWISFALNASAQAGIWSAATTGGGWVYHVRCIATGP